MQSYLTTMLSHSISKFLLVGIGATLLQYGLLILFVEWLDIAAVPASALSYGLSALANYFLNYYVTFTSRAPHLGALAKFAVVASLALGLNTGIMYLAVSLLNSHYIPAQLMATLVVLVWNFLAHKYWTYKFTDC